MTTTKQACGCVKKLAMRLSEAFPVEPWHLSRLLTTEQVGNWLEIAPDEAQTLIDVGLLPAWDGRVKLTDVTTFLEQTDWLRRRAEKKLLHLQAVVAESGRRRRAIAKEVAAEAQAVEGPAESSS